MTFVWRLGVLQLLDFFKFLELCLSVMGLVLLPYISENSICLQSILLYNTEIHFTPNDSSPQNLLLPFV
ncbi:hypothetical protein H8957_003553, partial [Semnopithecus entellus]